MFNLQKKISEVFMPIFQHTIDAHHDFEFNSALCRKIDYSISLPEGDIDGLVVFIAGFGDDAGSYRDNFQNHISNEYSMACLAVDYHCFFSRPNNGGAISIEPQVMAMLRTITGCVSNESVDTVLSTAEKMRANHQIPLRVPGLIVPKNNEYQNFGILPALDHIYAINDIFLKYPQIPKKIIAVGSSYGGYIANLISKLAPSTLNGCI
jgi:pimeloyl-ACP methyl ester carboxylesterase